MHRRRSLGRARRRVHRFVGAAGLLGVVVGCEDSPTATVRGLVCDLDSDLLVSSLAPNAIPALTQPDMVTAEDPDAGYLLDTDRILGVYMNGEARAYPHNILWHHEIVNDRFGDDWVSVTFCPLTGSGLAFDPQFAGAPLDLGVSGLLYANNLVLYDRVTEEVYGPQLSVEGRCGAFRGQALTLLPVQEMSWGRWKTLNPNTSVVSGAQVYGRNYRDNPYGSYGELTSNRLLYPMPVDRSRLIKERVLAIRVGSGGRGYPFGELGKLGAVSAVHETVGGIPTVVFFDASDGQTALAFDRRVNGRTLTFEADGAGFWTDLETGSTWRIDGSAVAGPLMGTRLETRADSYTVFWFAWRHFQTEGSVFRGA